jgi:hypothetical protein
MLNFLRAVVIMFFVCLALGAAASLLHNDPVMSTPVASTAARPRQPAMSQQQIDALITLCARQAGVDLGGSVTWQQMQDWAWCLEPTFKRLEGK